MEAERDNGHVPVVVVNVEDPVVSSMNRMLGAVNLDPERKEPCTIYRVLRTIRDEDHGAYEPKIISIGPFHRGNQALLQMEPLKWRFLDHLIHRHPSNSLEKFVMEVRSLEAETRKCYSEPVDTSDAFVEMMVLDGCFIIEFLLKLYLGNHNGQLHSVTWSLPLLRNDLLLLENQIPFFLLQRLFDSAIIPDLPAFLGEDVGPDTLTDLAAFYLNRAVMGDHPVTVHHLLDLFHSSLRPAPAASHILNSPNSWGFSLRQKIKHLISLSFFWVLSLLLNCRRPPSGEDSQRAPRMTPSATELDEAGVKFVKKEAVCFLDITFRDGIMEIPLISIQAATVSQFRNLIAFEQCCPSSGSYFTSYVALMDNLIDTTQDVALLESCGVLESKLGGDKEVARFFNSIGKGAYLDYENHYLVGLFKEVRDYCATDRHRYKARLVHDYFSNPWTIISLVAAFVLLVLTMVQTFFAVYGYFHPP